MSCARQGCSNPAAANGRFCSRKCQNADYYQRYKTGQAEGRVKRALDGEPTFLLSGELTELLLSSGIGAEAVAQAATHRWVADQVEALTRRRPAASTVGGSMAQVRQTLGERGAAAKWEMSFTTRRQLMLHRVTPTRDSAPEVLEAWLDEAVEAFIEFEATYWTLPNGGLYVRKDFHRRWIRAILRAHLLGGQQLILSPPRHGKSELLAHICTWLIGRNRNIRIVWVGPNADISEESVGSVREMLEDERLTADLLGPGGSFAPRKRIGGKWKDAYFTVEDRAPGIKGKTMTAQGKGAKILSKDADFIIGDDLEDYDSTETDSQRQKGRDWFLTQLESRKMYDTAWMNIGSRQHPGDLWGYLIDDPTWDHIVESAHDRTCVLDPAQPELHVDCMLFPEVNPYPWLRQKMVAASSRGQIHLAEMVYLNDPAPEGAVGWTRDEIKACHNPRAGLGLHYLDTTKHNYNLIAGIDPAAVRYQAAFCWAVELLAASDEAPDGSMLCHMVDLDNHLGGGVDAFIDGPGETWRRDYGLRHWVAEKNLFRTVWQTHPRLMAWSSSNGVTLDYIDTQGQNKWDPLYGVKATHQLWVSSPRQISVPYGTQDAREKVEIFTSQLLRFTDDRQALHKRTTDVLMASWFPMRTIYGWLAEWQSTIVDADRARSGDEMSYAFYRQSEYAESPY